MKMALILLIALLLWLVWPTLATAGYQIYFRQSEKWIENNRGVRLTTLKDFKEYKDANGNNKLKLVSQSGFSLDNIPMDSNSYYEECVLIFLDAEKYLPLCRRRLAESGYQVVSIKSVRLKFPDNPVRKGGQTQFKNPSLPADATESEEDYWLAGWYDGWGVCTVTNTLTKWHENTTLHEYIHFCGYDGAYHGTDVFEFAKIENLINNSP